MKKMKKLMALVVAIVMCVSVIGVIPAKAATETTTDISWFAGQNGNPWSGSCWTYLTGKDGSFEKMANYIASDSATANFKPGWSADENATTAYIGTWRQQATQEKWAVTAFDIAEEGNITGTSSLALKTNGAGSGDVIVVLKNAEGFYPVWPAKGEWTWQTVADATGMAMNFTTGYKAGDSLYYIVKPSENVELTRIEICPKLTFNGGTATEYPTTFGFFGGNEVELAEETTDIGWFAKQNAQPWSGSPWTFEYFDATTQTFQQLETFVSEENPGYWKDSTGTAIVKSWEQLASHEKYAAVVFTATQNGLVKLSTTSGTVVGGNYAGQFMLLQRKGNEYHVLLDWTDVDAGQTVTLPAVETYVKSGEVLYWITRSTSTTQKSHMSLTPKVMYTYGAMDTESIYPTEWESITSVMIEQEEMDIAWYAQQNTQPWPGSPFTFEYFSVADKTFKQLEVHMTETQPYYWQSTSGAVIVKGWEQRANSEEYAAVAVNASNKGIMSLTTSTGTIVGGTYDGQFMFVQKSGELYHALTEWIEIAAGATVTLPEVKTYVNAGDVVYYVYKSSNEEGHMFQSTPKVLYAKDAADVENLYPTDWKELVDILIEDTVEELPTLRISSATLKLENDITVVFKAKSEIIDDIYTDVYAVVTQELENGATKSQTITGVKSEDGNYYEFMYTGVAAKEIGDLMDITIYGYNKGSLVTGETKEDYGIMSYCLNQLKKSATSLGFSETRTAAFKTLLVDIINYASEAQVYFNYKTDALVSGQLTEEYKALASLDSVLDDMEKVTDAAYEVIDNPSVTWNAATLQLLSKATIRVKVTYA